LEEVLLPGLLKVWLQRLKPLRSFWSSLKRGFSLKLLKRSRLGYCPPGSPKLRPKRSALGV